MEKSGRMLGLFIHGYQKFLWKWKGLYAWEKQIYIGVKMGMDWLGENCGLQGYIG